MRHHGQIKEDRRGLARVVGLLLGLLVGTVLLRSMAGEPVVRPDTAPALARPFLEAERLGLTSPAPSCPPNAAHL